MATEDLDSLGASISPAKPGGVGDDLGPWKRSPAFPHAQGTARSYRALYFAVCVPSSLPFSLARAPMRVRTPSGRRADCRHRLSNDSLLASARHVGVARAAVGARFPAKVLKKAHFSLLTPPFRPSHTQDPNSNLPTTTERPRRRAATPPTRNLATFTSGLSSATAASH